MKAVVFGATGFIGSHVVEQLVKFGHKVSAIGRIDSHNPFLESLGVSLQGVDHNDTQQIQTSIPPSSVVYNCIAYRGSGKTLADFRPVEVELTRRIAEAAAQVKARRYIQLSSIIVYGNHLPDKPIDESFPPNPELVIDQAGWEREQAVRKVRDELGLDTVILQPASTIGRRDPGSFFYRVYQAHLQNKFPLIGGGKARFSCVDTRDIGRAMVWLGEANQQVSGETYLLKGYDITWLELKQALDQARGVIAGTQKLPKSLALTIANLMERLMENPPLDRRTVHALTAHRL